ncbi:MAG: M24 family metallopeptidase [Candidatus Pacebacteria bacterium]|nr:M24 family metallopeptidase [Candidatus Paceibacterota bacterium]
MWTSDQIKKHTTAAKLLEKVKDETFQFLRENKNAKEHEVNKFILKRFKQYNLVSDRKTMIVGFNAHAAIPHYFPSRKSSALKLNTLVLLDMWARLREKGAPYADITWMGFSGKKVPKNIQRAFNTTIGARDAALAEARARLSRKILPVGKELHETACKVIIKAGFKKNILHGTGHALGFTNPHGNPPHLSVRKSGMLRKNIGYTVEPGIYLPGKFGIRSEMNFYIDNNFKLRITTPLQKKIVFI